MRISLALALIPSVLCGQANYAELSGTIADATGGVITALPITPEAVLDAIDGARA